jgi:hypothetical protein
MTFQLGGRSLAIPQSTSSIGPVDRNNILFARLVKLSDKTQHEKSRLRPKPPSKK